MTKLRYIIIALILWLVFFFNIERVLDRFDITKYFYVLMALVTIVALLVPNLKKVPIWFLVTVPTVILLIIKFAVGDEISGNTLPIIITETFGIVLSLVFIREISSQLSDFETAVGKIAINYVGRSADSLQAEQEVMYRELKRAKLYERPLGVLTLKPTTESLQGQLPVVLEAYRESLFSQMSLAKVVKVLDQELHTSDIIVQDNDTLVVFLPEVDSKNINKVGHRILNAVESKAGYQLDLGVATYPEDAITFESLLNTARERLDNSRQQENVVSPEIYARG